MELVEGQLEIEAFRGKDIRRVLHNDEWWFSIVDVIAAVTESKQPSRYWNALKIKLYSEEGYAQLFANTEKLKMPSVDGRTRRTDSANTETMFRIIQSVPSKKAEPFKRWLAKVGYERILEIQNPEIAIKRAILEYKIQGRNDEWVDARVRSILARNELTSEWSRRGVREGSAYAILTNVIQKGTFGVAVKDHKRIKLLKDRHNLRDHMTDMELIFTMLGEKSTRDIARASNAQGFPENEVASMDGGKVAGDARIALEKKTGKKVVSKDNFLGARDQSILNV